MMKKLGIPLSKTQKSALCPGSTTHGSLHGAPAKVGFIFQPLSLQLQQKKSSGVRFPLDNVKCKARIETLC